MGDGENHSAHSRATRGLPCHDGHPGSVDAANGVGHGSWMRCENCGAPLVASAGKDSVCSYCGSTNAPQRQSDGIGVLVDQLLAQVQSGAENPGSTTNKNVHFVQQTTFNVNGKPYSSLEQLPPELRNVVSRGLAVAAQQAQGQTNGAFTVAVSSSEGVVDGKRPNPSAMGRIMILLAIALVFVAILLAVLVMQAR